METRPAGKSLIKPCLLALAVAFPAGTWAYWGCWQLPLSVSTTYAPPESAGAAARAAASEVRVLTLSAGFRPRWTLSADDARLQEERLAELVQQLDSYDVLLLQDVWLVASGLKQQLIAAARRQGFQHWARSGCLHGCAVDGKLLLLSRHPLQAVEELAFRSCRYQDCLASKGALFARVVPFGNPACAFEVVNTHLQTAESSTSGSVRADQLLELKVKLHFRSQPRLVAGDLSIGAGTAEYEQEAIFTSYVDVVKRDLGTTTPVTVAHPRPTRPDYLLWQGGDGGIDLAGGTSIDRLGKLRESDHYGVATTLRCPVQGGHEPEAFAGGAALKELQHTVETPRNFGVHKKVKTVSVPVRAVEHPRMSRQHADILGELVARGTVETARRVSP